MSLFGRSGPRLPLPAVAARFSYADVPTERKNNEGMLETCFWGLNLSNVFCVAKSGQWKSVAPCHVESQSVWTILKERRAVWAYGFSQLFIRR
jgi:hypothetical protein